MEKDTHTYLEIIERKANLKIARDDDKKLFPIGVRHQKELKNLFDSKCYKMTYKIDNIKMKLFNEFKEFYKDEVEEIKTQIIVDKKDFNNKVNDVWEIVLKDLYSFLDKKKQFENYFKGDISYCDNNYSNSKDFLNESFNSIENDLKDIYLKISSGKINTSLIIEDCFSKIYHISFDQIKETISKLELLFNESVVLGDLSQVREIYYAFDELDKDLELLEILKVEKIENIFDEELKKYNDLMDFDIKNFNFKKKSPNNNKIVDV